MIEVDYDNYLASQIEWADGLLKAAEHAQRVGDSNLRDLTLAAGSVLLRLSNRDALTSIKHG